MPLAVLKGHKEGSDVAVDSTPFIIGRCQSANFNIPHVNISRKHCQIIYKDRLWKIHDSSSSGTYINDKLIGKGESALLNSGDVVRFGSVGNKFSWTFCTLDFPALESGDRKLQITCSRNDDVCCRYGNTIKNSIENEMKTEERGSITPTPLRRHNCTEIKRIRNKPVTVVEIEVSDKHEPSTNQEQENDTNKINFHSETTINKNDAEKSLIEMNKQNNVTTEEISDGRSTTKDENTEKTNDNNCTCGLSTKSEKCMEETEKEILLLKEIEEIKNVLSVLKWKNYALMDNESAAANDKQTNGSQFKTNIAQNFLDLIESELQCTICSELFVKTVTLGCTHSFCEFCLNQWKIKQKTCPICRKKITIETRSLVVDNYIDKMVEQLSGELKERRETLRKERKEVVTPPKKRRKVRKTTF